MGMLMRRFIAAGVAAGAAVAARRGAELGWTLVRGEDPPTAADVTGDAELRDLVLWSALVAGAVIVARLVAKSKTKDLLKSDE